MVPFINGQLYDFVSIYKEVKGKQGKYLRDLVTVSCKGDPESYHPDPMHIKRG